MLVIEAVRRNKKISRARLAILYGGTLENIRWIELKVTKNPRLGTRLGIATALGVPPDLIFKDLEELSTEDRVALGISN